MTTAGTAVLPGDPAEDLRVARVHLRMGQLALARAELEDLAGRESLDVVGLAVLAEARWRTGDSRAAAEAAAAHLSAGGQDAVAVCIAAEAAASEGRAADAQALIARLPGVDAATLDAIFAGLPRRAFWPAAQAAEPGVDEIRSAARSAAPARPASPPPSAPPASGERPVEDGRVEAGGGTRAVPGPREVMEAAGAWADIGAQFALTSPAAAAEAAARPASRIRAQLDPHDEVARAREEMGSRADRALLRLALALRADPTLAPAVLDAIRLRREPAAALLRGDAQRLLGRHLEAEAAFDAAAESIES